LRYILLFALISCATEKVRQCTYGIKNSCSAEAVCIQVDQGKASCLKPVHSSFSLSLPFKIQETVECDQGTLSPPGNSHTWQNTAYALDLKSARALEVVAVSSGEVISFDECKTSNDQCGLGFGNQVKVLSSDGMLVFYAHLKSVAVRTGQQVRPGDILGVEGDTGWTGKNNPHLHFSVHSDWREKGKAYWQNVGFLPPSVPFKMNACFNGCGSDCATRDVREIQCRRVSSAPARLCRP